MKQRCRIILFIISAVALATAACSSGGEAVDDSGPANDIAVRDGDAAYNPEIMDNGLEKDTLDQELESADAGDNGADTDTGVQESAFKSVDLSALGNVRAMWASQEAGVWAVGDHGLALRYNGLDFVPTAILPTEADLFGIAGEGAAVIAVGASGTVLRFEQGKWESLAPPTDADLYGVGVLDAEDFYVVGKGGVIMHYKDGEWTKEGLGVTYDLYGAYASKVGGVYAVGAFGTLVELKGTVWIQTQIGGPASTLRSIWRSPDGRMYAVGTLGTVSVFDGITWKIQVTNDTYDPPRDLYEVRGLSGDEVYAVGDDGAILKYNGKKWTLATIAGPYNVFSDFRGVAGLLNPDGTRSMFAAGLDSRAVRLQDKAWADQDLGVTGDLDDAWVRDDGTVVAVGSHGLILTYRDGRLGTLESGTQGDLKAVSGGYVVGASGALLKLDQDEVVPLESKTGKDLNDVRATDEGAWVVGDSGTLLHVVGSDVSSVGGLSGFSVKAVDVLDNGVLFVAGEAGKIYVDEGSGFKSVFSGTYSTLWDLWSGPGEDKVYAVGDNGVILTCDTVKCDRLHEEPTTFLYGMGGSRGGAVLAVGWAGTILRLTGGDEVERLDAGTFRVFRAVAGDGAGGSGLFLVGDNGTFVVYSPEALGN
ncbi:MAG: hypothetical protein GXP54_10875 [Deltaproteobacteria bacterium]|nr:hypothetical protein [Deltaproteobacteria bacterium]